MQRNPGPSFLIVSGQNWISVGRFLISACLPLLVITFFSIWFLDSGAAHYFKSNYGNPLHLWARSTTDIASAGPYFGLTAGCFLLFSVAFRMTRNESWRRARSWALFGFLSLATGGILVQVLKHIIGRKRPYAEAALSSHEFSPLTGDYEYHSLPSGHSQVLFSLASILTTIWPKAWWLWMGSATALAVTRAITLNHWLSDVVAGGVVGMFGTVLTIRLLSYKKNTWHVGAILKMVAFVFLISVPYTSSADTAGPFGLGLVVGDPTGLSANYRLSAERSVDAAVAWSFGYRSGFELHSDYLWHRNGILKPGKFAFDLHYGVGGRLISIGDRNSNERTFFGPRFPVGLSTNFNQTALEVFAELALVMDLIPSTSADLDFGVGARVYF